jgi:hypothetical protein
VVSAAHNQQLTADQRRRNQVEGVFGSGNRKYSLQLIMARLPKGAETSISMAFLAMCTETIQRLLCLLLSLSVNGFVAVYVLARSWWRSVTFACLRQGNGWLLHGCDFELPSPLFSCFT